MAHERMEALDTEIGRYVHEKLEREGPVTGWVLNAATSRLDDDGDPMYGWDDISGPQTNFMTAVGLVRAAQIAMDQRIWHAESAGDDE